MTAALELVAETHEEWREAATAIYLAGKALIDDGKRVRATATEDADGLSIRQLRFIHGPVLQQISEQVRVNGIQYTKDVWKQHLKDLFIPDEFVMVRAPFVRDTKTGAWRPSKRKVPMKKEKSLTSLTGKRRSEFIEQVLAHAVTEWGVRFVFKIDEQDSWRYVPPVRQTKARPATAKRHELQGEPA